MAEIIGSAFGARRRPGPGGAPDLGWIDGVSAEAAPAEPESVWSEWSRTVDHWTVRACMALFGIGVVLAFATSPDLAKSLSQRRDVDVQPFEFAWRHLYLGAPALMLALGLSFLSPRSARRLGIGLFGCGLLGLVLVLVLGATHGSATRWFSVAGYSLQPSEFVKPGLVIFCAWLLAAFGRVDQRTSRSALCVSFSAAALVVLLLILQPDYGQSALVVATWAAMYFVAGGSILALIVVGAVVAAIGAIAYHVEPHIAARINAFLDPSLAANGQVAASERAIANGGWLGIAFEDGGYRTALPDAHADFVIAVAAEQFGYPLVVLIIGLFAAITLRALNFAAKTREPFQRIATVGLSLLLGLQAWVHIGVSAQILPATGMTLPFISLGGSSLIASALTIGLLLALTRRAPSPA